MFLPWLAILGLLALPSNRTAKAWFVLVPLLCIVVPLQFSQSLLDMLPSGTRQPLTEIPVAVAFGLAAVWLLAKNLVRKYRFVTFLIQMVIMALMGLFAYLVRQNWDESNLGETMATLVILGLAAVVLSLSMLFTGLLCKREYNLIKALLCLAVSLCVTWLVTAAPFFLFSYLASSGQIPLLQFFLPIGVVSLVSLGLMLPFLVLSSLNTFHGERLRALLHIPTPTAPEAPSPTPPPTPQPPPGTEVPTQPAQG